jgi:hypothetical protein
VAIHNKPTAFGCKLVRLDLDQIARREIKVDGASALLRKESTMNQSQSTKWMTHGEAGLFAFFTVSAFLCMFAAAKAVDAPFAFHASLSAVSGLAAVFFILDRYFDRPSSPPAQEIDGKPNYNMGPIKFAAAMISRSSPSRSRPRKTERSNERTGADTCDQIERWPCARIAPPH